MFPVAPWNEPDSFIGNDPVYSSLLTVIPSFNKYPGGKALIMVSGDLHMLAYSHGGAAANPLGEFPVF